MLISSLKHIQKKLAEPFPFTGRFSDSAKTFAIISSFVLLFVLLFRSDYLTQNGGLLERLIISALFGLVTFLGASLNTFILRLLLPQKKEETWKVRHEIALYGFHFFTIALFNFLVASFVLRYVESISVGSFLSVVASTFLIGIMPVSMLVLQQQKKLYQANYQLATELNQSLQKEEATAQQHRISLNKEEVILEEIVFAESRRNYVSLSLSNGESITVRMTLKEMEKAVATYPQLIRCHRAFMVNLDKLVSVEGNAQGLRLFLEGTSGFIPVSRSYIAKIGPLIR